MKIIWTVIENAFKNMVLDEYSLDTINIQNLGKLIDDYFYTYDNLKFLFENYNIKDIINEINEIIPNYPDKKYILDIAKTLFEKILSYIYR
jgi:hypothetical protein